MTIVMVKSRRFVSDKLFDKVVPEIDTMMT